MSLRARIKQGLAPLARSFAERPQSLPAELWGMARDPAGSLRLHGHDLDALARSHGTPLQIHDAAALRRNVRALSGLDAFFSYKTQPLPAVLASLHSMGVGAEVISEMELNLALSLGVPGAGIIYNGPAKSERSLRTAMAAELLLINVNHREELLQIAAMARQRGECGQRPRIGIRVTGSAGWSAQFGTPIANGEALALFEEALALPELDVVGVHMHRGALIHTEADLRAFLAELLAFVDSLHARLGWSPEIVDAGGSLAITSVRPLSPLQMRLARGFGIEVGASEPKSSLSLDTYAALMRSVLALHFESCDRPSPTLVIEPGRALCGNAQLLLASVVGVRDGKDAGQLAILDAGINIASILRVERHQIFLASRPASGLPQRYRLVGPICQPGDVLVDTIWLPQLRAGDVLAIMDSGAYFEPDSTAFSFPRPGTLAIDGKKIGWMRRPETLADVVARDQLDWGARPIRSAPAIVVANGAIRQDAARQTAVQVEVR